MKRLVFLTILVISYSCNMKSNNESRKGFYSNDGGWDYARIPLIEPFELIMLHGDSVWSLNTSKLPNYSGDMTPLDKFHVERNFIIGHLQPYVDEEDKEFSTPERWFILNTSNHTLEELGNKERFNYRLDQLALSNKLIYANDVLSRYRNGEFLPWFPKNSNRLN